jgi:S-adenosylmethionine:tRNA-ribosyltransferase-isomerase (queuine synthetase)
MGQSKYNFLLPPELLASDPATPRDASRLFVYDTASDTIQFDHFFHIDKYLPRDSTLVLNKTRVIPSRITLEKRTGGKIVCLFLLNEKRTSDIQIRAMVDRKISVGDELYATGTSRASKPLMTCMSHEADSTFLFELSISRKDLVALLERQGTMPIPLYLRHTALSDRELHERYQTVYARDDRREQVLDKREHTRQSFSIRVNTSTFALSSRPPADSAGMEGSLDGACTEQGRSARDDMSSTTNLFSVAAPTAGLHFTQRVFTPSTR